MTAKELIAKLQRHPSGGGDNVDQIETRMSWTRDGALALAYVVNADIKKLRVPAGTAPSRADDLWRHTCFEAFIALKDGPAYYEFNFSPSGQWAVYGFRAYRERETLDDDGVAPETSVRIGNQTLVLDARVPLKRLPMLKPGAKLRLGLSAVIEGRDGALSYWALTHPAARPDFHHSDSFTLDLAVPAESA